MLLNLAAAWGYNQFQKAPKDNILNRIYDMSPQSYAFNQQSEFAEKMAIDAFNREAAYNSPAAQMERYKEAGLNPNLIYGQGNSGNVSASTPSASHAAPAGPRDLIGMLMQVAGFVKEMQVKDAQINNLNMGAGQKEVSTMFTSEKLDQLRKMFPNLFREQENKVSVMQPLSMEAMRLKNQETEQVIRNLVTKGQFDSATAFPKFRQLDELVNNLMLGASEKVENIDLKRKEQMIKKYEQDLLAAQSSLSEYGITNPQALGQLLLQLLFQSLRK